MPRPNRRLQRSTVGLQSAATMADLRSFSSPSQPRHSFQTAESFPSQQNDIPFAVVLVAALQDWLRGMVLEQARIAPAFDEKRIFVAHLRSRGLYLPGKYFSCFCSNFLEVFDRIVLELDSKLPTKLFFLIGLFTLLGSWVFVSF